MNSERDEIQQLRRCLRDVVALSAMPAIWIDADLSRALDNLADVLRTALHAELIYIRVRLLDQSVVEAGSINAVSHAPAQPVSLGSWLAPHLEQLRRQPPAQVAHIQNQISGGEVYLSAVPIAREGEEVGTLAACLVNPPDETDRLLLSVGGNQIGMLLRRWKAEEERRISLLQEQNARQESEMLNEVIRTIAVELDVQGLVQKVTDIATASTGAQFGAFFYNAVSPEGESYVLYSLSGAPREAFAKLGLPRNTAVFDPTFRGIGPIRIADVRQDPRYGHNPPHHGMPPGHFPVRSYLAVPVVARSGEVIGGLFFGHPNPGVFTERAERLAMGIAGQAAIAIDNARLYEQSTRAAEQLRDQLAMSRAVTTGVAEGLLTVDLEGHITFANPAAQQLLGYAPADVIGRHIHETLHVTTNGDNSHSPAECPLLSVLQTQDISRSDEDNFHGKEGGGIPVFWNAAPILSDGVLRGAVYAFHDITDRLRAMETTAELAAIVASSEDAIISKTLEGIVVSWNAAAERLFGYTAAEAIGRPMTFLIPPDRLKEEGPIIVPLSRGECVEPYETLWRRQDGQDIHVSLSVSHIKNEKGQVIGIANIVRDITLRKRNEAALQANAARFQSLALTHARLYSEAERANRLKDDFLATMSHELRTPLHAIYGWIRMVRSGMVDKHGMNRAHEMIERNARAQMQLIEDLLDVSRIITGKLSLDIAPIELPALITAGVDTVRPAAAAKQVRIELMLDPSAGSLSGDAGRLQQVVWNLVSNAVKFTQKGGYVQVRLERVNSHIELTVSDNGQGINPEFLPYVFDRFRQENSGTARQQGGLGLGLAIVRHLVELHGGTVHAYSAGPGQGATFTVKLPVALLRNVEDVLEEAYTRRPPTSGLQEIWESPQLLEGTRMVVVEDDDDSRLLLVTILEGYGAAVIAASSVAEALQQVVQWKPAVLLSDIEMPGEDGYALIKRIRSFPDQEVQNIPALALTAHASMDDRVRALSAGFDGHVAKPFEAMELITAISRLVVQSAEQQTGPNGNV